MPTEVTCFLYCFIGVASACKCIVVSETSAEHLPNWSGLLQVQDREDRGVGGHDRARREEIRQGKRSQQCCVDALEGAYCVVKIGCCVGVHLCDLQYVYVQDMLRRRKDSKWLTNKQSLSEIKLDNKIMCVPFIIALIVPCPPNPYAPFRTHAIRCCASCMLSSDRQARNDQARPQLVSRA